MPEFDNIRAGKPIDFLIYSLPFAIVFIVIGK